ncbi:MAG: glycosyltransferase [Bacteroidales bacterium]|nr:glycosyltransferase [Bacteroidales bacterium]MBR5027609.1 glycosyltransferase [Bacteroidales bacterium]
MENVNKSPRTAVLIPCYNEATTVADVVRSFREVLPDADIYVYDNNSSDSTAELAAEAGAIVRHEPIQGKGNVIRRMFREIDAECYIMVDGDNTYPAAHAPEMVDAVLNGKADMVIGDRLSSTYFEQNKRPFHNTGNRLVRKLICSLWKVHVKDIMTGYRAFSRRFVKLFPVMSGQFEIETEMTIHALDKRFMLKEIPIEYRDRPEGSKSKLNTFSDGWKVLRTIVTLFKEYRPMRFFGWLAVFLAVVAVALFVPVLVEYFQTGLVRRFPTLFVSLFLFLAALQSLFTGLCLDVMVEKDRKTYELRLINFEQKQPQ